MADLVITREERGGKTVAVRLIEAMWTSGQVAIETKATSLDGSAGTVEEIKLNIEQARFVRDALDYLIQKAVS